MPTAWKPWAWGGCLFGGSWGWEDDALAEDDAVVEGAADFVAGEEAAAAGGLVGGDDNLVVDVEDLDHERFILPDGGIGEVDVGGEVYELSSGLPEYPAFVGDGGQGGKVDDPLAGGKLLDGGIVGGLLADGGAHSFDELGAGVGVLLPCVEEIVAVGVGGDRDDGAIGGGLRGRGFAIDFGDFEVLVADGGAEFGDVVIGFFEPDDEVEVGEEYFGELAAVAGVEFWVKGADPEDEVGGLDGFFEFLFVEVPAVEVADDFE